MVESSIASTASNLSTIIDIPITKPLKAKPLLGSRRGEIIN